MGAPPAIVNAVMADIHRKLQCTADFDKRQWWSQVSNAISDDPQAAQAYAAEVLAIEQLPAAEKTRLKEEKAKTFVLAAMHGKEPTDKQLSLIRSKGYVGEMPQDRGSASKLIDALLRGKSTL